MSECVGYITGEIKFLDGEVGCLGGEIGFLANVLVLTLSKFDFKIVQIAATIMLIPSKLFKTWLINYIQIPFHNAIFVPWIWFQEPAKKSIWPSNLLLKLVFAFKKRQQFNHPKTKSIAGWENRKDVTSLEVPNDCVRYITGEIKFLDGEVEFLGGEIGF